MSARAPDFQVSLGDSPEHQTWPSQCSHGHCVLFVDGCKHGYKWAPCITSSWTGWGTTYICRWSKLHGCTVPGLTSPRREQCFFWERTPALLREKKHSARPRMALLIFVAEVMSLAWMVEQPSSSMLRFHPRVMNVFSVFKVTRQKTCVGRTPNGTDWMLRYIQHVTCIYNRYVTASLQSSNEPMGFVEQGRLIDCNDRGSGIPIDIRSTLASSNPGKEPQTKPGWSGVYRSSCMCTYVEDCNA